jgi:hypothetical protein
MSGACITQCSLVRKSEGKGPHKGSRLRYGDDTEMDLDSFIQQKSGTSSRLLRQGIELSGPIEGEEFLDLLGEC